MNDEASFEVNIDRILDALRELSDELEQRRLWLSSGAGGAEISSFTEAVEALFTDSGLSHSLEQEWRSARGGRAEFGVIKPVFDKRTDSLLERLDWLISKVDLGLAPAKLIDSAEMKQVRSQASDLLTILDGRTRADRSSGDVQPLD